MADNVSEIMTKIVVCFEEDDGIVPIAKEMKKKNISCVIIKRDNMPVGVITEKDMSGRVVAEERDIRQTKAGDIMSSPVHTIPPETNIFYTSKMMKKTGFKRFPVMKNKKLVGIITQSDILRYFNEQRKQYVLDVLKKSGVV